MKILQVFDFFSPYGGGTVSLIYRITQTLAQKGHNVSIYTSDSKIVQEYIDSLPEVKVHVFHCISGLGQFYITPGLIREAKSHLKEFDVVHLHCFRSFQNIVIHHYTQKYGIPYILDTHGSLPRSVSNNKGAKWLLKGIFDVFFGYRILKDARKVVAETQTGIEEYREFHVPDDKIVMITPPFAIEEFAQLPPTGLFRHKYNISEKHIIMFLGRIHQIKGLDFLVESFYELTQIRDDVILIIAGNNDGYQSRLENLISRLNLQSKIIFTGFLEGRDKLSALVDADVLAQTSRYEYGTGVPFEAIMCNIPVVVTKNTSSGKNIESIDAGYAVEYGNTKELTSLLQNILNNPTESKQKTLKAKDYIKNNLSPAKVVVEYEKLYEYVRQSNKLY